MSKWVSNRLILQGKDVPCTIRIHPRSKGIRLSIRPDTGLVATVAPGCTTGMLFRFVLRHQAWVLRHVERMEQTAAKIPKRWPYGRTLPYQAEEHEVVLQPTSLKAQVIRQQRQLIVHLRQPTIEAARRLLKRWYWTEALRLCHWHAMDWRMQLGVRWRRLRIRDQRHSWGSCSARGYLNFNYRLVMAPVSVMAYVVLHELAHLKELNHSARFWQLVASYDPAYRQSIYWLRTFGPYLSI